MVDCPYAAAKKALRYLARRVLQQDREIAELLEDLDQLTQKACPSLRKTYGIAVDVAVTLLVAAGEIRLDYSLMKLTASRSLRLWPLYVVYAH